MKKRTLALLMALLMALSLLPVSVLAEEEETGAAVQAEERTDAREPKPSEEHGEAEPSPAPAASEEPEPSAAPEPSPAPAASEGPEPSAAPEPSRVPEPSKEPEPSRMPEPTPTPKATPSPSSAASDVSSEEEFSVVAGQLRAYRGTAREVFIPRSVQTLSTNVFRSNTTMEILHIPATVRTIYSSSLTGIPALKTVYVDNPCTVDCATLSKQLPGVEIIIPDAFGQFTYTKDGRTPYDGITGTIFSYTGPGGDVVIPEGITNMRDDVFRYNTTITSVTVPDTLRVNIGQGVFRGCLNLRSITASDTLRSWADWELEHKDFEIIYTSQYHIRKYLGNGGDVVIPADIAGVYLDRPFADRSDITSITFADTAKDIPDAFFQGCTGLKKVTAPASAGLTFAHFYGCTAMTDAGLPDSLRDKPQFELEGTKLVHYLGYKSDVVVPEGVTEIASRAFESYKNYTYRISSITLPSTLTTLNEICFSNCYGAEKVVFPKDFDPISAPIYFLAGLNDETLVELNGETKTKSVWEPQLLEVQKEKINKEQEEKRKEEAKNSLQQAWDNAYDNNQHSSSYLKSLQENRAFIQTATKERNYKYTWVTPDIQALSDRLSAGLTTDREKILAFHDWATENIYYDYEAYHAGTYHSSPAQEVLDERKCVCNGYAFFMQAMCWAQRIPALYVNGPSSNGYHAWNLIKVDGEWKWMDATWDTNNGYYGGSKWEKGGSWYSYCLCPSEYISIDHTARAAPLLPGINVDNIAYYGILLEEESPTTIVYNAEINGELLFTEQSVAAMNRLRRQEGLQPVKLDGFYLYYPASPGYNKTETAQPNDTQIIKPVDAEEQLKQMEEEYTKEAEDQHASDLKDLLKDPNAQNGQVNTDLYPHDWALDEVVAAMEAGLVPTGIQSRYADNITRLDFCRLMVALVEKRGVSVPTGGVNPFTDVNNTSVTAAYYLGIVKGVGDDRFNPSGSITRQEAAVMLARAADLLGLASGQSENFADADTFADWGRAGILRTSGLCDPTTGNKVMQGTGGGYFSPLMTYSREQAILTSYRLFNVGK